MTFVGVLLFVYVYKKERVEKGPSKYEKQKIEIAHPRIEEPNLGENYIMLVVIGA